MWSTMNYVSLSILFHYTSTVSINVDNAGFELDTMPNGDEIPERTYQYGSPIITNWTPYDPNSISNEWCFGVSNPINTGSYVGAHVGAPEGNQNAWIWIDKVGQGEIGIIQQLSDIVTTDTIYTLTVYVGDPTDGTWSNHSTDGATTEKNAGFPEYRVDLLAGNDILGTDNNTLSINEGYWQQSTVTVNVYPNNPYIGQTLSIRLINLNQAKGNEVAFDFVRLNTRPITTNPTLSPTNNPTPAPTSHPTPAPTNDPTLAPTNNPTPSPTEQPSPFPTDQPTPASTNNPTPTPTEQPTPSPTEQPTPSPTYTPTVNTKYPTNHPTIEPTKGPTNNPTTDPTQNPTKPTTSPINNDGSGNVDETVTTKDHISNGSENDGAEQKGKGLLLFDDMFNIIIICVSIFIVLLLCIIGVCVLRKYREKNKDKILVEMHSPTNNNKHDNNDSVINTPQSGFMMNINTEEGDDEMEDEMIMLGPTPNGAQKVKAINKNDGDIIHITAMNGNEQENGDENEDETMNDITIGNTLEMIEDVFNENDDEKWDELPDGDEDVLFTGITTAQ